MINELLKLAKIRDTEIVQEEVNMAHFSLREMEMGLFRIQSKWMIL